MLQYKQITFIVLMMLYYIVKVDLIKGLFNDIKERFDYKNMGKNTNDTKQPNSKQTATSTSTSISSDGTTSETDNPFKKECTNKSFDINKEDIFCNKKIIYDNEDKKRYMCSKNALTPSDVLKPSHAVPYNVSNTNGNNLLYTINPTYTESKLKYERQLAGGVVSSNKNVLHKNYDKHIESYKIGNIISTILNNQGASYNGKFKNICFVKDPITFQRTIKLLSRIRDNKIIINWNIPIMPNGYFPKKLIFLNNKNKKRVELSTTKDDIYEIELSNKSCSFEDDNGIFKIDSILYDNRFSYILTFEIESLFPNYNKRISKQEPILFNAQVLFFFDYYNNKQHLQECYMESNMTTIDTRK